MTSLTAALHFEGNMLPAKAVSIFIHELLRITGIPEKNLAQGVGIAEAQLNRMASRKIGTVRTPTVVSLKRIATVVDEARKTLSPAGVKHWLSTPNPYLNDVAPILCLRSDKEMDKVVALLSAIRHGFPA